MPDDPISTTVESLCESAIRRFQSGNLAEAECLSLQIIARDPENFIGCYLLGLIHYQRGQNAEALKFLGMALNANPVAAEALAVQGLVLQRLGRFEEALSIFDKALAIKPTLIEVHNNRGNALCDMGRYTDALASYDKALGLQPLFAPTFYNRGVALQALRRFKEALRSYDRALELNANYIEALKNRGTVLQELKRFDEALLSYDEALKVNPKDHMAWFNRGTTLQDLKCFAEAQKSFDIAITIRPDFAEAFSNRGAVLQQQNRHQEALADFSRAAAIKPDDMDAWVNYANALREMRLFDDALPILGRIVGINPDHAVAWNNLGAVLQAMERYQQALESFDKALALRGDYIEALWNRGLALEKLERHEEALATFDRVLANKPDYAEALYGRGNMLWILDGPQAALKSYDRALLAKADYPEALNNRGRVLASMRRFNEALESYDRALALKPDFADALYNRGNSRWSYKKDFEGSVRDLERVVAINPKYHYARGDLLHLRMHGCAWKDFESEVRIIDEGVRSGERVVRPFIYQALSQAPVDLQSCSRIYSDHLFPFALPTRTERHHTHRKIRVGYMSGEFREQATAYLTAGLYELHDKSDFEIIAIDTGYDDGSPMRKRLEVAFSKWIQVSDDGDRAAAEKIRAEEIDILVNLNGYFGDARMSICAHRPAPIQVNYLGFPATLGANYVDYIIADRMVIPEAERDYYTEKVVYLPHTYQVNDSKRRVTKNNMKRAEHGLPDQAFVFCNFNQSYKLTPEIFFVWVKLLRQVEGSVLWLLESNKWQSENLKREIEYQGIAADRLIFAPRIPPESHLARLALADLFLDNLPYNAHTTASDALWMGLPLLTCIGSTFPGRVAASVLEANGVPELITGNLDEYEALAVRLARDRESLISLRRKLGQNRDTSYLFNTDVFRQHIESAYRTMWGMHQRGHGPESFTVAPLI
jgi:protein O-GlcNAc transferase